ncbi:MAG: PorV/PorQ family protein [Calditrichia bacterium]
MTYLRNTLIIMLFFSMAIYADGSNGATGLSFLKIGADARGAGMGDAFTAVSNDANATYWNPAGLAFASRSNATFQHNSWLQGIRSEYGALQFKGEKSSLAFHAYAMSIGEIEVRTIPSSEPLEETSANYTSVGVSYARLLSPDFSFGITAKYLYEKIFIYSASGYAADLGVSYRGLMPNLTLAASFANLGSMNEFRTESTDLPKILRLGGMYERSQLTKDIGVLLAADFVKPLEEGARFSVGLEATVKKLILLRSGFISGSETRNVSFGVGIAKSAFRFDYAFTPVSDDLGSSQRFSLYLGL